MKRTIPIFIICAFGSLLIAGLVAAQDSVVSEEPATDATSPPQPTSPGNPAPPPPPAPVQAPHPPAGPGAPGASSGGSFSSSSSSSSDSSFSSSQPAARGAPSGGSLFGRGGRARAVISVPGGGFAVDRVQFGMEPGSGDTEMSKLIQSEHELERKSHELISKYASSEADQLHEEVKTRLREMLEKQFDLQNQRRELELKRVEERLAKLREQLQRRTDAREQIVNQRLEYLVNEAEGLGWTAPAAIPGSNPLSFGSGIGPRPRPSPRVGR